jgi:hypothetical protein
LVGGYIFFGEDGIGGAFGNADGAVDALVGINDQKVGSFAKAINRTNVDTVGEFAFNTVFGHDVRHKKSSGKTRQQPLLPYKMILLNNAGYPLIAQSVVIGILGLRVVDGKIAACCAMVDKTTHSPQ